MKRTHLTSHVLPIILGVILVATVALADPGSAIWPTGCSQKQDGVSVWHNEQGGLQAGGQYAFAYVGNPFPNCPTNRLLFYGWPETTTGSGASVWITMRQQPKGDPEYALYAVLTIRTESGESIDLYPDDAQHITTEWVTYRYPIGRSVNWKKANVSLLGTSDKLNGTYLNVDEIRVQ